MLRRNRSYAIRLALLQVEAERSAPAAVEPGEDVPDERLRLFFTCCHPPLPLDAQIALTLRCLAGLDTPEVARRRTRADAEHAPPGWGMAAEKQSATDEHRRH